VIAKLDPAGGQASGDPPAAAAPLPEAEVWSLLGRADVVLRGVLEARDREQRRIWEERARAWLRDVNQAWVRSPR
jgi:hypothetical protein